MYGSSFVSDAEVLDYLNNSYARLYNILVTKDEDYYSTTGTISLVSGTISYALPTDVFKIQAVEFQLGTNQYVTLKPYNEAEKNVLLNAGNIPSGTVRVRYIPQPTIYSSGSTAIDGISGWEEFIVIDGAIQCKIKEESDTAALERRLSQLRREIEESASNRDMLFGGTTTDIYRANYPLGSVYSNLRYKMYGVNIEFINIEALAIGGFY